MISRKKCIKTQHFNFNRILLLLIGLWPYQQSIFTRLQFILCFSILISFIVFQFTTFMTTECTPAFIFKVLSSSTIFILMAIKYGAFLINNKLVMCLLEQLQHIYNELKDDNEIAIIIKYGKKAKFYTVGLTLAAISGIFLLICLTFWPLIFDVFLPINESRPHFSFYIVTEYFVDQEEYYYFIMLHINAACFIGAIIIVATGSILMAYMKHACGMFKIASYRIERAMTISTLRKASLQSEMIIFKELVCAIDMHRKAMNFVEILIFSFEKSLLFMIGVTVISLSSTLFRVASYENDTTEFFVLLMSVINMLTYMFITTYLGQEIIDHNNHIFFTAYDVRWYIAPLHIQRLILFLLQRGNKDFNVNIGGLFVGCLQTFASLTSASVSYFTVMYSMQ